MPCYLYSLYNNVLNIPRTPLFPDLTCSPSELPMLYVVALFSVRTGPWRPVTARFVTRFNLWLRHDLWPHNASICDPARFVTKSASICDQRYTMILESNLCRWKLVFVFTLIMYTQWYNMMIYIYELWYDTYINSGARSLMLFTLILLEYHAWHIYIIHHVCVSYFMHYS